MKNIILVTLLLSVVSLFACKKKSNHPSGGNGNNGPGVSVFMKGSVNGTTWAADTFASYITQSSNNVAQSDISIVGTNNGSTSQIAMYITNFTGAATYNIDPPAVSAVYYVRNERHYATSGQIVITTYMPSTTLGVYSYVQGTYTFTADSINANGSFSVDIH